MILPSRGNAYIEAVSVDGLPREWHNLRPDRMSILPGRTGWPAGYEYTLGAQKVTFPVEPDGVSPVLHLKLFHPLDDHYDFAPLCAAQTALDIHNAAGGWNKALLDNAARPSGALVYTGPDGASLSEEQFERLRRDLDESFSGREHRESTCPTSRKPFPSAAISLISRFSFGRAARRDCWAGR